jgi:iron(III) transport system substrate-binding protein
MNTSLKRLSGLCLLLVLLTVLVFGSSLAETTAERVEKAKKEGQVNFYFIWNVPHGLAIKKAFMKKYPFIKVNTLRQAGARMLNKLDIEAKAGRHEADVIIISDLYWQTLMDRGLVGPHCSPERPAFAAQFKDEKCLWTAVNNNSHVIAYNTDLVPKGVRPKTLQDLLHPRWKEKLVMDTTDDRWFTQTLDKWGEEKGFAYMKKLALQKPHFRRGHTLMVQLLAAGEFPVNVMAYGYQVEYVKSQGASIDWSADEPVTVTAGLLSLAKHAPHPEAAKLLIDFITTKEAQEIITKFNRVATRSDVPPNPPGLVEGLKFDTVKPELGKILPKRIEQFREIFTFN